MAAIPSALEQLAIINTPYSNAARQYVVDSVMAAAAAVGDALRLTNKEPTAKVVVKATRSFKSLQRLQGLFTNDYLSDNFGDVDELSRTALAQECVRQGLAGKLAAILLWMQQHAAKPWMADDAARLQWCTAVNALSSITVEYSLGTFDKSRSLVVEEFALSSGWLAALPQSIETLMQLAAVSNTARLRTASCDTFVALCSAVATCWTCTLSDPTLRAKLHHVLGGNGALPLLCSTLLHWGDNIPSPQAGDRDGGWQEALVRTQRLAAMELSWPIHEYVRSAIHAIKHQEVIKVMQMVLATAIVQQGDRRAITIPTFHKACDYVPKDHGPCTRMVPLTSLIQYIFNLVTAIEEHQQYNLRPFDRNIALCLLEASLLSEGVEGGPRNKADVWSGMSALMSHMQAKAREEFLKVAGMYIAQQLQDCVAATASAVCAASPNSSVRQGQMRAPPSPPQPQQPTQDGVHATTQQSTEVDDELYQMLLMVAVLSNPDVERPSDAVPGVSFKAAAWTHTGRTAIMGFAPEAATMLLQAVEALMRAYWPSAHLRERAACAVVYCATNLLRLSNTTKHSTERGSLAAAVVSVSKRLLVDVQVISAEFSGTLQQEQHERTTVLLKVADIIAASLYNLVYHAIVASSGSASTANSAAHTALSSPSCSGGSADGSRTGEDASSSASSSTGPAAVHASQLLASAKEVDMALLVVCRLGGACAQILSMPPLTLAMAQSQAGESAVSKELVDLYWVTAGSLLGCGHSLSACPALWTAVEPLLGVVLAKKVCELPHVLYTSSKEQYHQVVFGIVDIFTALLDAPLPYKKCCHNPRCSNLNGPSEALLKTKVCTGCHTSRFCSRACQKAAWQGRHKELCKRLQQRAQQAKEDTGIHQQQEEAMAEPAQVSLAST